jgi:UDP-glucose 4-epimerase
MHLLVAGGAGFIGSHSARLALQRGHRVTVVDDLSHGRRENLAPGAAFELHDLRAPTLCQLVARLAPDAVLHLAAQMDVRRSVSDPTHDASVNVLGTVNLLEAARRAGVRRFVFASSGGAIYGEQERFPADEAHPRRPSSPYGVSKLCGEEYLSHYQRAHGLGTVALRYANVYGPGQDPHGEAGVVAIFLERMLAGGAPLINGDGLQTRDYVFVEDVALVNLLALESDCTGALNVGTARETSVLEVSRQLAAAVGFTQAIGHGPAKAGEQRRSVIDPSLAARALGFRPRVALEEGLRETARWFAARKR